MSLVRLASRLRAWFSGGSVFELHVGDEPTPVFPPGLSAAQRTALSRFADLVGVDSREFCNQVAAELRHARGGVDPLPRCERCDCAYMPKPRGVVDLGLCKACQSSLAETTGREFGGTSNGR